MKEEWLSFTQFREEYPEDRYYILEIVRFEKGDVDEALQKITKISSRILKLDLKGDLITLSNFKKKSETRIVRSKTRRKATMIAKYVRTYNLPDFPIALVLAVEKDKVSEGELEEIKNKINEVLESV
jgi:Asp-tRNA(Asn)/Glu-tRNA(Gln) amidotransferase C subunit